MMREIEKKYLITGVQARNALVAKLYEKYPGLTHKATKRVISFFYERSVSKEQILEAGSKILNEQDLVRLVQVIDSSSELIVKCRSIDETCYFAVKGSRAGEDPVHAVDRLEFEVSVDLELEALDELLQDAGIQIVSKFSSVRDFYELDGTLKADIEFVAGYGYKAELEILINDGDSADDSIRILDEVANDVGLVEADGKLLARMYDYYNQHWQEYFNTEKVFDEETWRRLRKAR